MKNLLRKLHIGGSPASSSEIPHNRENSTSSSSAVNNNNNNSVAVDNSNSNINNNNSSVDYNYFEEEYQVQLALAISASSSAPDSGGTNDPESLQIKAAKRISLGHFPAPSPASSAVDFLSHRYWSYNVVDYDEKIIDGFYDVYCILSDPNSQGRMPSLVDLQETPVSSNVGYEVVLVNRAVDPVLCQLEEKALGIANDCITAKLSTLIQMVADLVATQMGGPVSDADEMLTKWTMRSYELRTSFNNIVLPLGCLQIGLSRHRALLFKVLADCVGIPCRLVKGSYYTGTDDGAVNFIKLDSEREFIIDLMGAPGALIPTETPSIVSSSKPAKESNNADQQIIAQAVQTLCSALEEKDPCQPLDKKESENLHQNCGSGDSNRKISTSEFLSLGEFNVRENSSNESLQSSYVVPPIERTKMVHSRPRRSPSWTGGTLMSEQMKVNDMSQYVLNAANENPEFAQKLHDVLLESGVSPPLNFFDSINSLQGIGEQNLNQQKSNFFEAKRISDAIKCGEKIESGPGRPPRPAAVQNNLISNTANENLLNEFLPNARAKMISACSAPLIEFPTSDHASASLFPGFPAIDTSKLSSDISSAAGQSQNSAGQQIFPLPAAFAASASVVDSSVVVATNKCDDLASSRLAVETYADTSLVNDRISLVKCGYNKDREGSFGSEGKFSRSRDSSSLLEENNVLDDVNECEIPWEDLQTGERIGLGSYGEVYHAEWNGTEVAVKKFLDQAFSGDALEQFRSEVRIMRRLRHPNIVLFMGAVTRPPNLSILTEFLPRGSLYRLLHRSNVNLDEKRRLRMALDVAKGMNYLHTSNPVIVHRDLKSPNLLVDKNWVVKVCDFGLSRLKHHTFLSSKSTAGTPEWMAPEVLRNEPANEKCDVYSFGVILWELATLRMPWSGMNPMQVVGAVGFQNRRLEIPTEVDQPVAQIIANCWQNDPSLRPSFGQLMISLKSLQRLLVSPL